MIEIKKGLSFVEIKYFKVFRARSSRWCTCNGEDSANLNNGKV